MQIAFITRRHNFAKDFLQNRRRVTVIYTHFTGTYRIVRWLQSIEDHLQKDHYLVRRTDTLKRGDSIQDDGTRMNMTGLWLKKAMAAVIKRGPGICRRRYCCSKSDQKKADLTEVLLEFTWSSLDKGQCARQAQGFRSIRRRREEFSLTGSQRVLVQTVEHVCYTKEIMRRERL